MNNLDEVRDCQARQVIHGPSTITAEDIRLFKVGAHFHLYDKLGSHMMTAEGGAGVFFSIWAPNAQRVSVIGNFNGWNKDSHPLAARTDGSGIWEGFIPGVAQGGSYKYHVASKFNGYAVNNSDPYGFFWETPPKTATIVWDLEYEWHDQEWIKGRGKSNSGDSPISIYEVHLGSWRRVPEENNRPLDYRETAYRLAEYVKKMGFTHVEFMPVMEHPFYGSWGYQVVGYFAPTSRYGDPQNFMFLVDYLHQNDIGVILDWVPSHFPSDEFGLVYADGTHLYEHADRRKGFHPDWQSYIFDYGRNEVREFLIGSAVFWLDKYHADGLRVDGVASMLYLDYSRRDGEWVPNKYGGRENLEAIDFMKRLNGAVREEFPDVRMIAEESTAWPSVSRPISNGGLGFGMKWNMGWMHDTLDYMSKDPIERKHSHNQLTFGMLYAFHEDFILSLSHDEVVHGKKSLLAKMPGDDWQRFANLRLLYGYMFTYPGKKLLFMGDELGQWDEWNHEQSLDWHLLDYPNHSGIQRWVAELNKFYRDERALHELDFSQEGFKWIDHNDWQQSVICYMRKGRHKDDIVIVICNFTPVMRRDYRIGMPFEGVWLEVLNSDAKEYGGSGAGNPGWLESEAMPFHGMGHSVSLTLPPLAVIILKRGKKPSLKEGLGDTDV